MVLIGHKLIFSYLKLFMNLFWYIQNFKCLVGPSWPWSYGSWIYNYLCNQFLSPLMWIQISISVRCTQLC